MEIFPGVEWQAITVVCICLFIGAMGKSAQVPLHVWLPDSMEGPTPISALIHAATMVTAGIFMVARMSPLFELSETALSTVLVIGATTAFFMGLLGLVNNDIKRVVAYSTLSQLGYMTVALGASAYSGAIFHLMTHAFFKALLFLAAGSVIIAHASRAGHAQDGRAEEVHADHVLDRADRLARADRLSGHVGFFSKDALIEAVHASHIPRRDVRVLVRVPRRVRHRVLQLPPGVHDLPWSGALPWSATITTQAVHGSIGHDAGHEPMRTHDDHAHDDAHGDARHHARRSAEGSVLVDQAAADPARDSVARRSAGSRSAPCCSAITSATRSSCCRQHDVLGHVGEEFHGACALRAARVHGRRSLPGARSACSPRGSCTSSGRICRP